MSDTQQGPIIEMTDAEGHKIKAELYEIFEFDQKKYALLLPLIEGNQEEVNQFAVMSLMQDGDQYYIQEIESDLEYARVVEFLQSPHVDDHKCGCGCHEHHLDHECGCGCHEHHHDHECDCGCDKEHDHHCSCGCENK